MTHPARSNAGTRQICTTPDCGNVVNRLHRYGAVHKRCMDCEDHIARFGYPRRIERGAQRATTGTATGAITVERR